MVWTLDFTLKGYLYGPVKTTKIIKFANTQFFVPPVGVSVEDAVGNTPAAAYVTIQPGLTANGEPTSNASLSIPVSDILATDDFGFVIDIVDPADQAR